MGLEDVELMMDVEDAFGIALPDEPMQRMVTVGDLYDLVLPLVRETGPEALRGRADLEAHLWLRVRELAAAHAYKVRPEEITRDTRFVEDLGYG